MTQPLSPLVAAKPSTRLLSLDAYRGAIMLFMASSGFGLAKVAEKFPDSAVWKFLAFHTSHAPWIGGGAWDMIQPSFMFMVGVAMPFSLARRAADGQSFGRQFAHAALRALILVGLGVFLGSNHQPQTNWLFTNVLAQIGLGYLAVFALARQSRAVQIGAAAAILVATWAAFAWHSLPAEAPDLKTLGIKPADASHVLLPGFLAHWNMNANVFADFDRWFLNLFPREKPFAFNPGGYTTLNFVPSIVTMLLGLFAGQALRGEGSTGTKLRWLIVAGAACLALGLISGATVCPVIKRIWTPSWALYSGGITLWILAAFFWAVEIRGWRAWTWPLVVVGMNSIAIYLMHQLLAGWIRDTLRTHLGANVFTGTYGIVWQNCAVLLVLWLACWWMFQRKIFLRI